MGIEILLTASVRLADVLKALAVLMGGPEPDAIPVHMNPTVVTLIGRNYSCQYSFEGPGGLRQINMQSTARNYAIAKHLHRALNCQRPKRKLNRLTSHDIRIAKKQLDKQIRLELS